MKIQSLAIIFIIIILPISLILASYTKTRVETISLQSQYDSKLNDATHDALKAYQLNSFSSDTSDYTNSKIRDIKGSVNTFFNSMSTNFATLGYTKETLQNYVPAIVYTMYDGYYIYSPYKNTWDIEVEKKVKNEIDNIKITEPDYESAFSNGDKLYGLKPYVYYSCRYIRGGIDVVITYSLDNYIQIQGKIDKDGQPKTISKYGYLLSNVNVNGDTVQYKGIEITKENLLEENVYVEDEGINKYQYKKINGTKYYKNGDEVFTVLNGKKIIQQNMIIDNDDNAYNYYKEAYELYDFMKNNGILELTTNDIVDIETGNRYGNSENPYFSINGEIFDFDNIESEESNFNTHRIDVIKNSIERNLSIAISNFNNYTNVLTEFQMPKLKDTDWDKIMDNISIISFFQGANIGGKVYNGYSIITNTKNEDVVMNDSIYIKNGDKISDITEDALTGNNAVGIFNINTERRVGTDGSTYFLPVEGTLSYGSIITKDNISDNFNGNLIQYIDSLQDNNLKKIYYTALGRERYGLYRQKLKIDI